MILHFVPIDPLFPAVTHAILTLFEILAADIPWRHSILSCSLYAYFSHCRWRGIKASLWLGFAGFILNSKFGIWALKQIRQALYSFYLYLLIMIQIK